MGHRWKNLSFRLPAFILLASLVPLAGFGLFALHHTRSSLLEIQARATTRTAVLAAELVEQRMHDILNDLRVAADNLDLLALSPDDREWALLTILKQKPVLTELALLDAAGQEQSKVAIDDVFSTQELALLANDAIYRAAIQGREMIGEPQLHDTGGYLCHVGVPLTDPATGAIAGVLRADVSLRDILENITNIKIGHRGRVYVLNARGLVIAHEDFSLVLGASVLPVDELLGTAADGEPAVRVFTNAAGVEVQGVLVPVHGTDWLVVGDRPMDGILRDMNATVRLLQGLLAGLVVILLPVIYLLIRRVTLPLQRLEQGAEEIGAGRFGAPIPATGDDEIGRVSRAFNSMAESLRQKTEENEQAAWLKSGLNGFDAQLRGSSHIEDLGRRALSYLANYAAIPVAALYVCDDQNRLRLTAGFAHDASEPALKEFALGEGLVGQVAYERQVLQVHDVPAGYLTVSSGLGSAGPQSLLLIPLFQNNAVVGVLEFGTFQPLAPQVRDLLERVSGPLAVAITAARARQGLSESLANSQRLIEELQASEEELQTQQEELQATNAELENQTQRLQASEEELQAANEELEEKTLFLQQQQEKLEEKNRVLEINRERLEQQARDLEVASRYKSEFLANMSHELRTPLNSLLILSQDLMANHERNLNAGQIEATEVIFNSGNDLLQLINEILDLSKIEAGKMELNIDELPLVDVCARLERSFQHMAQAKGLDFTVVLEEAAPEQLTTDVKRLEQILKNLVANALKFTTHGSVSLLIGRPRPGSFLPRGGLDVNRCCAFTVNDTGIGIPENKLEEIFGAFQQVDGSISRQFGGTGLGLTISRELAHLLGGELQVRSEEGVGSTFTLYLPLTMADRPADLPVAEPFTPYVPPPSPLPEQEARPAAPSLADDRERLTADDRVILIVEDDLAFARILAGLCQDKGFRFLHAGDGETGLALAAQYQPSAILLDIRLPGMHGLQLLEVLKDRTELRHIPVHVVSVEDRGQDALQRGAVGFLSKPTSKEALARVFSRLEEIISGRVRKLLIVEDDPDLRQSIVQLVGSDDVDLIEAATGREALERLQSEPIDCMILDLSLPDMTGFELLKQFEKLDDVSPPPVIVYTGRDLSGQEEMELRHYTSSIIIKGARSPERLLDETSLFLHRVVAKLPAHKQRMISALHDSDAPFAERKILLVDDDMRNVFAISRVLEQQGLTVIKAINGEKALEALAREPDIDLVLMDIMMPVMDGYEAMQRIRQQPQFAKLPILALTAKAMPEDRGRSIEAGANDYLAKPVDIDKLLSLLRVWLYR